MTDIAIAVPCFNSALTLAETLDSLIHCDFLSDASIVLLDGGSTDFTREIVSFFASRHKHRTFVFCDYTGIHPAERVNRLMASKEYEFIFLCHSDDIYLPSAMQAMLSTLSNSSIWALGSQNGFYQHPKDAAAIREIPYVGLHSTHPLETDEIYCEMSLWWSISWNTIVMNSRLITEASIKLEPGSFPFSNDYAFNWELAKLGKLQNVPFHSVITRHRGSGDGPSNLEAVTAECGRIRECIQSEIGLTDFLGRHLLYVLRTLSYCYGSWDLSGCVYPRSHYLMLATRLKEFSQESARYRHFSILGQKLEQSLLET
jgi:glycosyltransferase involved in cell wall biosynthesis